MNQNGERNYWMEKIVCFFRGHWKGELFLPHPEGYLLRRPGCLRCRKAFVGVHEEVV